MGLVEFIFAVLIVVPVAVVMFRIFRNLTGEYNSAIKKERARKKRSYNDKSRKKEKINLGVIYERNRN